jgi:hypothetical protein
MKTRQIKNPKTGIAMSFFSALCFFGASIFAAKSGNKIWVALLFIATMNMMLGIIILKKWKQDL